MGLDFYEVVLEVEEEFDIKIPDVDWPAMVSVGELYEATLAALRSQRSERFANASYEKTVWEQLENLLVVQLGLEPEQVVPSARFYYELGFQ